jgi:1,5-anhydro-D-fructose reductase (1,5-anhydro-D-mannitol-forming)
MKLVAQRVPPTGWAVIGASTIAREFMVGAIRANGGDILWVVSDDRARADDFAYSCGIPRATARLGDALGDLEVDAVYIGSTNSRHREQGIAAAEAGKHVLCDKPIATRSGDALQMLRVCERTGVTLAVNHHLRGSAVHQRMRKLIAEGAIGDVRSVTIMNAGMLRPALRTWRVSEPAEGGIYLDLSVHDIDLARFILMQEPLTVVGIGAAVALGAQDVHDHVMFSAVMSGGSFLQVHESFITPSVESQLLVLGSEGYLLAIGTISQRAGGELVQGHLQGAASVQVDQVDPYAETVRQFVLAIETGRRPLASGWDGLAALTAAEAVASAVTSGRAVNVTSGIRV